MKEYINEFLTEYETKNNYPWHMPGHKRQSPFEEEVWQEAFSRDYTEARDLDDMHEPEGFIKNALEGLREIYHTYATYMMVNGSTGGVFTAVYACATEGDVILLARNCHKSVYNAVSLLKLCPEYIMPKPVPGTDIYGDIRPEQIEESILSLAKQGKKPVAAIITSPTYEGVISDIAGIRRVTKKYDILLIVDEAHGAHLTFMGEDYSDSAIACGADIVVESVHKTLPALTQTALLHVNNKALDEKVRKYLQIFQTSSPSYIFMQSIEKAVNFSYTHKEEFDLYIQKVSTLRKKCYNLKHIRLLEPTKICYDYDICKLVFILSDEKKENYTGKWLADKLADEYHQIVEMVGTNYVIAMTSICDKESAYEALFTALKKIDEEIDAEKPTADTPIKSEHQSITLPEMALTPGAAMNLPTRTVELTNAKNCIAGDTIYAYPPGIPVLVPGEKIDENTVVNITKLAEYGLNLSGVSINNNNIYIKTIIN